MRRFEAATPVFRGSYGQGIAISGDVMVVGAPGASNGTLAETGLAEVWERIDGGWQFRQYLQDPTPHSEAEFGASIDTCGGGRFIVVGAPGEADGDGSVYVYERVGDTWTSAGVLSDPDASDGAERGYSVAIDCTASSSVVYAATGAPFDEIGDVLWGGSVSLWKRDAISGDWSRSQRLVPNAQSTGVRCGLSVDLSFAIAVPLVTPASRLLVGCPHAQYMGIESSGIAYLYARTGSTFSLEQAMGSPDPYPAAEFGTSVSLYGTVAAVGSPWAPHGSIGDAGRVWAWERTGVAPLLWEATELVVDDYYDPALQYFYGGNIAVSGGGGQFNVFASRQLTLSTGGGRCWHVVEAFSRTTSGAWTRSDRLASPDLDEGTDIGTFGSGVAASGEDVAIGAQRSEILDVSDSGAAFVFHHDRIFGGDFDHYRIGN